MGVTDGIRELVARDWQLVRESKEESWRERIERMGPAEGLRMAEGLRTFCLSVAADPGNEQARASDLAAHAHLSEQLSRAFPLARR